MPQKWLVLAGCLAAFFGHCIAILMPPLLLPHIISEWHLSAGQAGLFFSATLLGVGLSGFLIGALSDAFGRRTALILAVTLANGLLSCVPLVDSWSFFLILNFVSGIGVGGVWGVVAAFLNESWPEKQRSRAVSLVMSSGQVAGIVSAVGVNMLVDKIGWKNCYLVFFLFLLNAPFLYYQVKESDEWKVKKELSKNHKTNPLDLFNPKYRVTTILCTLGATMVFLVIMGWNNWIPSFLLNERGLSRSQMSSFMVTGYICSFVACQALGFISDRLGRKNSIYLLSVVGLISLPIFLFKEGSVALYISGSIFFMSQSYVAIFGLYFAELYPTTLRSTGSGFCFNVARGLAFVSPVAVGALGGKIGLSYGLCLLAVFIVLIPIFFCPLPETAKLTGK